MIGIVIIMKLILYEVVPGKTTSSTALYLPHNHAPRLLRQHEHLFTVPWICRDLEAHPVSYGVPVVISDEAARGTSTIIMKYNNTVCPNNWGIQTRYCRHPGERSMPYRPVLYRTSSHEMCLLSRAKRFERSFTICYT